MAEMSHDRRVQKADGLVVAVQFPSFGPHHVARLRAIAERAPWPETRIVGMEMFARDSDYLWEPVTTGADAVFMRTTVMQCSTEEGRSRPLALTRAVRAALRRVDPQVLVVKGWGHRESVVSLHWARGRRLPWVLACDSSHQDAPRSRLREAVKRWLIRDCPAAWVAGTPQAEYVAHLGVAPERIFYPGTCAVDNDFWAEQSQRARAEADVLRRRLALPERYFLSVSRFIPKKNLQRLIRAFARYRGGGDAADHELVLCGAGPEEETLRELTVELGLARLVHFPGFRQVSELPALYGLASCLVLASSHYEQWGLVVNEAMACALPVLVSRACGAARDLVLDGVNGFAFDPFDLDGLARCLGAVGASELERSAMGEASRRLIAGHSCEIAATNLWRAVAAATGRQLPEAALAGPNRG